MDDAFRRGPARGARPRRSWPQRLLICVNVVAILCSLSLAAAIAYGHEKVGETPRTRIQSETGFRPAEQLPPGEPENFLVVGTDDTEGLADDDPLLNNRDIGPSRSDVIMIVRIDPKAGEAKVVSIPRDTWVDIPGKYPSKINAAMAFGEGSGPSLLIDTIKKNFDITINHYVEVNFASFKNVIGVIGGVEMYLSHPIRDDRSGLNQPTPGCIVLDPDQALAYARSRNLSWQASDGEWVRDRTVDLGRIKRQKELLRRVIGQAIDKGARNPATLARLIERIQGEGSVKLDSHTTPEDLLSLADAFRSFEPQQLVTEDLPVIDVRRSGQDTLDLLPEAYEILAEFQDTGSTGIASEPDVSSVTVRVENGGAFENAAVQTTDAFEGIGFEVASPADGEPVVTTEVRFNRLDEPEARLVARYLGGDIILVQDPDLDAEIRIVLGPGFTGAVQNPRPEAELPTETVIQTSEVGQSTTTSSASAGSVTTTTIGATTTTVDRAGDPDRHASFLPVAPPGGGC